MQRPCVVLVADTISSHSDSILEADTFERAESTYFSALVTGLRQLTTTVIHYDHPKKLIDAAGRHRRHLVLSIWSGVASRNRRALIPSICEAYGLTYCGADTYTQILSQDKYLAKTFISRYGLSTPRGHLVTDPATFDFSILANLDWPLVVKPNFEGGSIGISPKSLVDSLPTCYERVWSTYRRFNQPILVEEFVGGKEVSIVIVGDQEQVYTIEAVEVTFGSQPNCFERQLFDVTKKKLSLEDKHFNLVTDELDSKEMAIFTKIFNDLGKVDYLRIDGKLTDSGFQFIELTPDAHLGPSASVAQAYLLQGRQYLDTLDEILTAGQVNAAE